MVSGEYQLEAVGHTFPSGTRALQNVTLSIVTALPLAMLAAANTSPHRAVYQLTRRLLDCMRA